MSWLCAATPLGDRTGPIEPQRVHGQAAELDHDLDAVGLVVVVGVLLPLGLAGYIQHQVPSWLPLLNPGRFRATAAAFRRPDQAPGFVLPPVATHAPPSG